MRPGGTCTIQVMRSYTKANTFYVSYNKFSTTMVNKEQKTKRMLPWIPPTGLMMHVIHIWKRCIVKFRALIWQNVCHKNRKESTAAWYSATKTYKWDGSVTFTSWFHRWHVGYSVRLAGPRRCLHNRTLTCKPVYLMGDHKRAYLTSCMQQYGRACGDGGRKHSDRVWSSLYLLNTSAGISNGPFSIYG